MPQQEKIGCLLIHLNDKYAKKEMKEQVIPVDRLITYIKQVNAEKDAEDGSEKNMTALAHFFLGMDKPAPDYTKKYKQLFEEMVIGEEQAAERVKEEIVDEIEQVPKNVSTEAAQPILCARCGAKMVLRTATKGDNVGKTFYGCSRFPKCRYNLKIYG